MGTFGFNLIQKPMRKKTLKVAFAELKQETNVIMTDENVSLASRFRNSSRCCRDFMQLVDDYQTQRDFRDRYEEIYYFKFEYAYYLGYQLFIDHWYRVMNCMPVADRDGIRDFFCEELKMADRFFLQYAFYYQYYKSGFTQLDDSLFLREADAEMLLLDGSLATDTKSTAGTELFAKLIAQELLRDFLLKELDKTNVPNTAFPFPANHSANAFNWTGEIINLVELGYAIYLSKQLNGGKAGLTEIFRWLEEVFNVKIGIPANRLREIKRRKRLEKLHFLAQLQTLMLEYIEAEDDLFSGRS